MNKRVLIVEDHFVEANNLQMILERAGYSVCPIARSVTVALKLIDQEHPDLVLIDIRDLLLLIGERKRVGRNCRRDGALLVVAVFCYHDGVIVV